MKLIERLYEFLAYKKLTPHAFEHACGISNGYLKKQLKGKGGIGSDILLKISENYKELSLIWILKGEGQMILQRPYSLNRSGMLELEEEENAYLTSREEIIQLLKDKVIILEATIADKEKIIAMLEKVLNMEPKIIHQQ